MLTATVWVVDDDEDDQLFIRSAFEQGEPPITVLSVYDGSEILPQLAQCTNLPRLILLDINMPLQNGFETLMELRSVADYAGLPVVVLTTSSNTEDYKQSLTLGANQFLTKPQSYGQLRAMVTELISQWKLTQA